MGRVCAAGNLCRPSWPSPSLRRSSTSHLPAPHLSLGGHKGVNTCELSGGRDGDMGGRHNKRGSPTAVLTTGKSCHIAHTTATDRQHPRHGRRPCKHTGTGVHRSWTGTFADEDTCPHTMIPVDMQNTHPDTCMHTCAYTHSYPRATHRHTDRHRRA